LESGNDWLNYQLSNRPLNAEIILTENQVRSLKYSDSFDIFYRYQGVGYRENFYKVENGKLYGFNESYYYNNFNDFFKFYIFDGVTSTTFSHTNYLKHRGTLNNQFFRKYGIIIEHIEGKLYFFNDIIDLVLESNANPNQTYADHIGFYNIWFDSSYKDAFETSKKLILDDVVIEENYFPTFSVLNKIIKYGVTKNIEYELIFELVEDQPTIKAYEIGTYIAPPPATITFQPINN
jgi:hypothetical protein